MKFVSSVVLISFFCCIQQFSQILCDDVALNNTIPSANATVNDTSCEGLSCVWNKILDVIPFLGSSSGSSSAFGGNNSDLYDYHYDYDSPIIEEVVIVPISGNGSVLANLTGPSWSTFSGWDNGNYNASSSDSGLSNDISSPGFTNDLIGKLFGTNSSSGSASVPSALNSTSATGTYTTSTSVPPSSSSASGNYSGNGFGSGQTEYGSGSGFGFGSGSNSGSGSSLGSGMSTSSSGGAIFTSAPSTSAPAVNITVPTNTSAPASSTASSTPATGM